MPHTVASLESLLVADFGPALIACGASGTPAADASPRGYLRSSILAALDDQGVAVADPTAPADPEVAAAADAQRLLDVASLRLVEAMWARFIQVDWSTNVQKQWLNQFREGLQAQLVDRRAYCRERYSYGLGAPAAFALDLGFTARDATAAGPYF